MNEISDNSSRNTGATVYLSIGIAAAIYLLVAITGYLSFGDNVGGNIIAMYKESISSTIGRAAIVVLVMFSYPLQIHPCRASVDNVVRFKRAKNPNNGLPQVAPTAPPSARPIEPMSDLRFAIITTILIVLTYTTAMLVDSLERVLAYVGSTGSTSISFILPGIFYWKISQPGPLANKINHVSEFSDEEESDHEEDDGSGLLGGGRVESKGAWQKRWLRKAAISLAGYGFVVMAICLTMNIFFSATSGH